MAQVVEYLLSKLKAFSSNPSTGREGGKEGRKERMEGEKRNLFLNYSPAISALCDQPCTTHTHKELLAGGRSH
jgi:hypothetical protein